MPLRTIPLQGDPLDVGLTFAVLRRGHGDPTIRLGSGSVVRATRTPDGPATIAIRADGSRVSAEAWGSGADRLLAALPELVGLADAATDFRPRTPLLAELARRLAGLRLPRTGNVVEALVPAILEQKVTGTEAFAAYRALVRTYGERAPGPFDLWVPPSAETLAALPYHAFHPLGVERRRADTIRHASARAPRLRELAVAALDVAYRRLTALPGVGAWTAAEVALRALGDRDAVSVGDFHLPHLVSWALAGEPRGSDARMLELLEPYRGHRARVVRLLEAGGVHAPRYGPRLAPRSIARI